MSSMAARAAIGEKKSDVPGHGKGVERGVIVIVAPGVGCHDLYGAVEHGRGRDHQA